MQERCDGQSPLLINPVCYVVLSERQQVLNREQLYADRRGIPKQSASIYMVILTHKSLISNIVAKGFVAD